MKKNLRVEKTYSGTNYGTLLAFDTQIRNLNGTVLYFLLQGKINEFYRVNKGRVDTLNLKMVEVLKEFFEYEGNDIKQIKTPPLFIDGVEQPSENLPVLLPGKTREEYEKKWAEFLAKPCYITI